MGRCGNLVSFSSGTIKLRELRTNRRRDLKQHPRVPGVSCRRQGKSRSGYFTGWLTSADLCSHPPEQRAWGYPHGLPEFMGLWVVKGKQNKGTKVTGGPRVVNESDQSLLLIKSRHIQVMCSGNGKCQGKVASLTKFPQNLSLLEQQTAASLWILSHGNTLPLMVWSRCCLIHTCNHSSRTSEQIKAECPWIECI